MSTLFSDVTSALPIWSDHAGADGHQSSSWPVLLRWLERSRQRNAFRSRIDDERLLADIGLTREQALREVNKPFWR